MPSGCSWLNHPAVRVLSGDPQGGSDAPQRGDPSARPGLALAITSVSGDGLPVNLVQQTLSRPALGWVVGSHQRYFGAGMRGQP